MKCSYQSGYKFDQINLELKVVVKLGDQYLGRRCALFQRVPRTPTCTFQGPCASNTTKIPRKDPQEREFGPPPLRAPTPPGPYPSGPPPLRAPTPSSSHPFRPPPKTKLAKCGIGQIRFGQMRPNKNGQIRFGQIWPRPTLRGPTLRHLTFSKFGPPAFGAPALRGNLAKVGCLKLAKVGQ